MEFVRSCKTDIFCQRHWCSKVSPNTGANASPPTPTRWTSDPSLMTWTPVTMNTPAPVGQPPLGKRPRNREKKIPSVYCYECPSFSFFLFPFHSVILRLPYASPFYLMASIFRYDSLWLILLVILIFRPSDSWWLILWVISIFSLWLLQTMTHL